MCGAALLWAMPAEAQGEGDKWISCSPPRGIFAETAPRSEIPPGRTALSADQAISEAGGDSLFRGSVVIQRDALTLQADEAKYDQRSGEVTVEGNVVYHGDGVVMQGERAGVNLPQQSGEFEGVVFHFPESHAFGSAEQLSLQSSEHSTLTGVRYTTCSPGQEDWLLSASELQLDQQSNTGEAYHTVFRFKGVPIFYSPYLNFPLAGRKSGLLPPTFGSSEQSGSDTRLPIYWNIAPNYDATFTPRYLSKRGAMLMSEFRYLGENSEGELHADHIGDDKLFGADRNTLSLQHRSHFASGWGTTAVGRRVSDPLYLSDLGTAEGSGDSQLERRFDLHYNGSHWNFLARAQGYQTLSGLEPYRRLPQLRLNGRSTLRPNSLNATLQSEAVHFGHDDDTLTTGSRLDLKPAVSLPLQGAAWYLTPTAAWRYSDYRLENHPAGERFSRSLPILSLDSGLFFDRQTTLGEGAFTHTLEPRLFYLAVPYRDQDALPLFDTALPSPGFDQLFRDNRYNGADRQSDTRQLTTALTTRLLDDASGVERLRASIGRSHYFEDRRVQLNPTDPIETLPHSDIFAELELQPIDLLHLGVNGSYDTEAERNEQLGARVRYQPGSKQLLSLDYRYDETAQLRQGDALLFWPLAQQWQLLGRWRYDLENRENLDQLAGVEYESCCWSLRLIGRNHRDSINTEMERSFYLTFEFKGLGSLGGRLEDALQDGLPTYD